MLNKPERAKVYRINKPYLVKMVRLVLSRYDGKKDIPPTEANLLEEGKVCDICVEAFNKAYKKWDGKRKFVALFRHIFLADISTAARKERLHRHRESTVLDGEDENGLVRRDIIADPDEWINPASVTDFVDFLNTLPDNARKLIDVVLNIDGLTGTTCRTLRDVSSALWPIVHKELSWTKRQYWEAYKTVRTLVNERMG